MHYKKYVDDTFYNDNPSPPDSLKKYKKKNFENKHLVGFLAIQEKQDNSNSSSDISIL